MNKNFLVLGAIGALVIIVGGVVVMKGTGGGDAMPLSVTEGVAMLFNAECRYDDPELCKFMNNWKMPTEYSMYSVMTSKSTKKMEFVSKIKGADSHVIMKEDGKVTHESITLAGVDYMKDLSDGAWWKITKEKAKDMPLDEVVKMDYDFTEKMEVVEDKTTYVALGKEACGKSQCYKYQILDPENTSTKEFVWFDDEDYLMRKTRSEEVGGEMSVSEMETTYEKVTIMTPSPVKEGTALDAYGASAGMSKAEIAEMKKQQIEAEKAAAEYMKNMNSGSMNGGIDMTWEATAEESPSGATGY